MFEMSSRHPPTGARACNRHLIVAAGGSDVGAVSLEWDVDFDCGASTSSASTTGRWTQRSLRSRNPSWQDDFDEDWHSSNSSTCSGPGQSKLGEGELRRLAPCREVNDRGEESPEDTSPRSQGLGDALVDEVLGGDATCNADPETLERDTSVSASTPHSTAVELRGATRECCVTQLQPLGGIFASKAKKKGLRQSEATKPTVAAVLTHKTDEDEDETDAICSNTSIAGERSPRTGNFVRETPPVKSEISGTITLKRNEGDAESDAIVRSSSPASARFGRHSGKAQRKSPHVAAEDSDDDLDDLLRNTSDDGFNSPEYSDHCRFSKDWPSRDSRGNVRSQSGSRRLCAAAKGLGRKSASGLYALPKLKSATWVVVPESTILRTDAYTGRFLRRHWLALNIVGHLGRPFHEGSITEVKFLPFSIKSFPSRLHAGWLYQQGRRRGWLTSIKEDVECYLPMPCSEFLVPEWVLDDAGSEQAAAPEWV